MLAPEIEAHKDDIRRVASRHGVGRVAVFGSCATGSPRPDSDVDFLIEVTGPTTPWFPGGLVADLESLLGRRVDVVEKRSIHPALREEILRQAVAI